MKEGQASKPRDGYICPKPDCGAAFGTPGALMRHFAKIYVGLRYEKFEYG